MGDANCTTQLDKTAAQLTELREDISNIAKFRAFPFIVETILISTPFSFVVDVNIFN
jgi:hypothetical protein